MPTSPIYMYCKTCMQISGHTDVKNTNLCAGYLRCEAESETSTTKICKCHMHTDGNLCRYRELPIYASYYKTVYRLIFNK